VEGFLPDICCSPASALRAASENIKATARLVGTVFVGDQVHQSNTAGAKVLASGSIEIETKTIVDNRYVLWRCLAELRS
jgi:hypothetical protein